MLKAAIGAFGALAWAGHALTWAQLGGPDSHGWQGIVMTGIAGLILTVVAVIPWTSWSINIDPRTVRIETRRGKHTETAQHALDDVTTIRCDRVVRTPTNSRDRARGKTRVTWYVGLKLHDGPVVGIWKTGNGHKAEAVRDRLEALLAQARGKVPRSSDPAVVRTTSDRARGPSPTGQAPRPQRGPRRDPLREPLRRQNLTVSMVCGVCTVANSLRDSASGSRSSPW